MAKNDKPGSGTETKKTKLYVVEEQEILCQAYDSTFLREPAIDVMGIVGNGECEAIVSALTVLKPDVVLLGTRMLQSDIIEKLEIISRHHPNVGIIVLAALYDVKIIKLLKAFFRRSPKGGAFLLKHSIDRTEQLVGIIRAVSDGLVIIDPLVKGGLFGVSDARIAHLDDIIHEQVDLGHTADVKTTFLNGLTRRELEVLSWMAKGLKNTSIAEVLCVDPRTIKCHINSIYSKLNGKFDAKNPRVRAIMLYLKAIGKLPGDESRREYSTPFSDRHRIEYSNLCLS